MKIGVCAKITPDTDARIKPNGAGTAIDAEGIKWVISPYDMIAIEQAIQTKEKHTGEVISYTVGDDTAITQLRGSCLALGADKSVVVTDPAALASDALGVARCLAAAIRRDGTEVVFCGKVAIDDDNVQVPAMLAALLGWPQVSRVVELTVEGSTFTATRNMDGGVREVVSGALPVVLTCDRGLNTPRYAKLPAIMQAKKKPVETLDLAGVGLSAADVAPAVAFSRYTPPPARPKGKIIGGDVDTAVKELVRLLREEAKVI